MAKVEIKICSLQELCWQNVIRHKVDFSMIPFRPKEKMKIKHHDDETIIRMNWKNKKYKVSLHGQMANDFIPMNKNVIFRDRFGIFVFCIYAGGWIAFAVNKADIHKINI